jgi:phenylacetate-CoA ligase
MEAMGPWFHWMDRFLRATAYDILCRRDRISGWKPGRDALLASIRKQPPDLSRDADAALQKIVMHAYDSCPHYRGLWDDVGFRPSALRGAEGLADLPFLTKEIIRERKASMVSDRFAAEDLELSYTGGTTGTQTSFYLDHACKVARVGRQWGMHELCGYKAGMRRALVWGVHEDLPSRGTRHGFKRWFRRYASAQETLACTVMDEHLMREYHGQLLRFRPQVMYGYPSALAELGRFIEEQGLEPIRVRTIITTAERLSPASRMHLQRLFGGEVFALYGTREYGCIAFECARHEGYHIDVGSVALEIVKDDRPARAGESGEIVVTDLLNYGMPFIRSRTGDRGALSAEPCACGNPLPLLRSLDGRVSELLYRPDGSRVPGLMLTDLFMELPAIRYQQFVQESIDRLEVRLVVAGPLSETLRSQVVREVRTIMGEEIAIHIRLVEDIERNPRSGKIEEVVCKVNRRREPADARV